ncbi:MAG: hypothetical protein ACOY0T_38520 [Myxococcota bacterium]
MGWFRWLASGAVIVAGACTRDLEGAACPCASGYECCVEENTCYPRSHVCGSVGKGGTSNGQTFSGGASSVSGGKPGGGTSAAGGPAGGTSAGAGRGDIGNGGIASLAGGAAAGGVVSSLGGVFSAGSGGAAAGQGGELPIEGGAGGVSPTTPEFVLVATQHNNNARTGANLNESTLTSSNVNATQFGELSRRPLRGAVFAQPLVAPRVALDEQRIADVVYVATMANVVYALDAQHPEQRPIWSRTLEAPIPVPGAQIQLGTSQIWHEVGVYGTPVLSVEQGALYVVAATKIENEYIHRLYKLSLSNGDVINAATIQAPGFSSELQAQRSALTVADGAVYVPFGGYDPNSYAQGWMFAYDSNLVLLGAAKLGNPDGAGITMTGQGPMADAGSIYFTTSLGATQPDTQPALGARLVELRNPNQPQLFERLFPAASVVDSNELAFGGPLLIPNSNRLVVAGQHNMYLVDRAASGSAALVQEFRASGSGACLLPNVPCLVEPSSPVFWPGSGTQPQGRIFVWSPTDRLRAFGFDAQSGRVACAGQEASCKPVAESNPGDSGDIENHPVGNGAHLSVSSNGSESGSGIVWAAHAYSTDTLRVPDGLLRAFDAESLSLLWSSEKAERTIGPLAPGATPTVSGGRVFMGTADGLADKWTFWNHWAAAAPGVANFDDKYLVLAWGLTSFVNRGFQIAWSENGIEFMRGNSSSVYDNFLYYEPALAADGKGHIFLAWTASTEFVKVLVSDHPNFVRSSFLTQKAAGAEPVTLEYTASTAPALVYGNGRLFLAWHDEDSTLHIISSADGVSFDTSTHVILPGHFSYAAPALSYLNGKLYVISTDNEHRLKLFVSSDDGLHFEGPTVLGMLSSGHPALFSLDPQGSTTPDFNLLWTDVPDVGRSSGRIKIASAPAGDVTKFGRTHQFESDTADFGINATWFKGGLHFAWLGVADTNHPNVARYSPGELVTYGLK